MKRDCCVQVTMSDRLAAERACKDANPIIDGRKANVNLAYLGAKPRGNLQAGNILRPPLFDFHSLHYTAVSFVHLGSSFRLLLFYLISSKECQSGPQFNDISSQPPT